MAKRLSEYGIKPKNIRIGTSIAKGYMCNDFDDVFARYLVPSSHMISYATPLQDTETPSFTEICAVAVNPLCSGNENVSVLPETLEYMGCSDVADEEGG